jgi:hypothetical protein
MVFPSSLANNPTYGPEFYFAIEILSAVALGMNELPNVVVGMVSGFLFRFRDLFEKAPRLAQIKITCLIR